MDLLQNANLGSPILLAVGCAVLCVVGLLLFFGLQILGTTLHTFLGLFQVAGGILNGGPIAWCGCLAVIFICAGLVGGTLLFASCKTNPTSMNFCLFFR
jgi:hypothetical protein